MAPEPIGPVQPSTQIEARHAAPVGIDLGDVVIKRETSISAWSGKRVAFDAWNILYQFLSNIRQPDGTPLKDRQGQTTSHLAGILYRTSNLVEAGMRPVFVFDGQPHVLKQETLAARTARRDAAQVDYEAAVAAGDTERAYSKAQQTSRLSPSMADEAKDLLRALGIPVVEAPGEGEAQAAWMCSQGHVDAVASQDFDSLLFGAPVLLRNLTVTGRRKMPGKQVWVEVQPEAIPLGESLEALGVDRERLIDVALLVGTDFHPGIKGIGAKKALQLLREEDLETLLERLEADPAAARNAAERQILEQGQALMERETVRSIFIDPPHVEADLRAGGPDREAVLDLMVERHDFSKDRVETALRRFDTGAAKASQQTLFDF